MNVFLVVVLVIIVILLVSALGTLYLIRDDLARLSASRVPDDHDNGIGWVDDPATPGWQYAETDLGVVRRYVGDE